MVVERRMKPIYMLEEYSHYNMGEKRFHKIYIISRIDKLLAIKGGVA